MDRNYFKSTTSTFCNLYYTLISDCLFHSVEDGTDNNFILPYNSKCAARTITFKENSNCPQYAGAIGFDQNYSRSCCGYNNAYGGNTTSLELQCSTGQITTPGLIETLLTSVLCSVTGYSGQGGTQTQTCTPLYSKEQVYEMFEWQCYDWSAKQQNYLTSSTELICPNALTYNTPVSYYEKNYDGSLLELDCCLGSTTHNGLPCPNTACIQAPMCEELLYNHCFYNLDDDICLSWKQFALSLSYVSFNQGKVSENGYFDALLATCKTQTTSECIGVKDGLLFDRIRPQITVNSVQYTNKGNIMWVYAFNVSPKAFWCNIIQDPPNNAYSITKSISFQPFHYASLSVQLSGEAFLESIYSFSSQTVWTQSSINSDPENKCENINAWSNKPSLTALNYPLAKHCYDGDSEISYTSTTEYLLTGTNFNSISCSESLWRYQQCASCNYFSCESHFTSTLGVIGIPQCSGDNIFWTQYDKCNSTPNYMCPYCFAPDDLVGSNTAHSIFDGITGCGCNDTDICLYGEIGILFPAATKNQIAKCRNDTRGTCSPTSLSLYSLSTTRTCLGFSAQTNVFFSTRTDITTADFPIMGGFIATFAPTGVSMNTNQIQAYPFNSFL